MSHQQPPILETPSDHHALLADPLRRRVLAHVRDATTEVASLEEVASEVRPPDGVDAETLCIRLHHAVLPLLEDAGVLEYDARSNTVHYRDPAVLDRLDEQLVR